MHAIKKNLKKFYLEQKFLYFQKINRHHSRDNHRGNDSKTIY